MMHHASWRKLVFTLLAASCAAGTAKGVEPVDEFLAALRARRMFDQAAAYLEVLKANPHVDESVRQRVLYEQGVTTLESAASASDLAARNEQFSRASELFDQFVSSFPQHALVGSAKIQSANILLERARAAVETASGPNRDQTALAAARQQYERARGQFDAAEKELETQLAALPKLVDPGDAATKTRKQQIASDLAQVRMLRPSIDYQLAASYDPASAQAKKHLGAAAGSYRQAYETYRTRAAGLLARLWEGRCYQQMGELKQALGCFRELMDLPDSDETRAIRTKSTRHALACLTSDSEKKYPEAIERGQRWEKETPGRHDDSDALAIRYLTALAYQAQSTALPAKDPNRKKLAGFARDYVGPVARHPGEFQRPAKMLLVALGSSKDPDDADDASAGSAFAKAFDAAKQALERMQNTDAELRALGAGESSKAAQLTQQKQTSAAAARGALRMALSSSDEKTQIDDLNLARYYLSFVEWEGGNLYDAAVLGEFLAKHYPDSLPGQQGARIALAAYIKMVADSDEPDKQFETAQLERLGEQIFERWKGQELSDEAALQLLSFAASQNQWDKALKYLDKVSVDSSRRGDAELRAGQALWSAYLRRSQLPEDERPPQAELDTLKKQAQEVLGEGIARMEKSGKVDATLAAAVFAMAQICVDTGQPDKAIGWLERDKIGPLTLVKAKNPVAARQAFATEAYKLALRAYVAVKPQQLKKAEEAMDALEQIVQGAGDAKAAENLTAIYISLGRELEKHLQVLRKSGEKQELEDVAKAFEVFLDRVTQRDAGNSYTSLNWVGQTYFSLGGGFDEGTGKTSTKARDYFRKATDAYKKVLEIAQQDAKFKDQPESLIGVRLRLADCYRRAGDFEEAIAILREVLKEKPTLLPAQVQAAETYQARGALDPAGYAKAILGGEPGRDGKNTIWGWAKLSKMTMSDQRFQDTFHRSRLSMAEARYRYAMDQDDAQRRAKLLETAKQDLWFTYKLRPELGGQETAGQYDRLLKKIQSGLGSQETGLQEFKQRDTQSAETAATK